MCSVIGYLGSNDCVEPIIEGLKRLEYRGYDSAGIALLNFNDKPTIFCKKSVGSVDNLINSLNNIPEAKIGIGHTRWSTHGVASELNAHPQLDSSGSVAVVHNGVIENYSELKKELEFQGVQFKSTTDTEVIAQLLANLLKNYSPKDAIKELFLKLRGAYSLVILNLQNQESLMVLRRKSPLCIGISDTEKIVSSDTLAFSGRCNQVVYLPDNSYGFVHRDKLEIYDQDSKLLNLNLEKVTDTAVQLAKDGFESFMLKEIYEQPEAIVRTVAGLVDIQKNLHKLLDISPEFLSSLNRITFIGCGSSFHAASIAAHIFQKKVSISCRAVIASEYRYESVLTKDKELFIAISQSGETADTLEVVRMIKELDLGKVIGLTNVASSSLVREADGFILTKAGPEIAVASTKAFASQLAALYWLAYYFALQFGSIEEQDLSEATEDLYNVATLLEQTFSDNQTIIEYYAQQYLRYDKMIFLGRSISYPFAQEAALKLKEIAYYFVEAYPAGELKHGPLALIDEKVPVTIFSCIDEIIYSKLVTNAQEVKARNGHLIVFAFADQAELISLADTAFVFPVVKKKLEPLIMVGVMQLFYYYIAKNLGHSIDRPRNLAKSVTVE